MLTCRRGGAEGHVGCWDWGRRADRRVRRRPRLRISCGAWWDARRTRRWGAVHEREGTEHDSCTER